MPGKLHRGGAIHGHTWVPRSSAARRVHLSSFTYLIELTCSPAACMHILWCVMHVCVCGHAQCGKLLACSATRCPQLGPAALGRRHWQLRIPTTASPRRRNGRSVRQCAMRLARRPKAPGPGWARRPGRSTRPPCGYRITHTKLIIKSNHQANAHAGHAAPLPGVREWP